MRDLIPSGRFAQLARLSRKALRLYDEKGLLRPAHVQADTHYRYYTMSQLKDAARIGQLRDLGMPLEQVRETLRTWGTPGFAAQLEQHREALWRQAATVQAALEHLEQLLNTSEQPYPVQTKAVAAQRYLGTRSWCEPDEACAFFDQSQQHLLKLAKRALLDVAGPFFARYHGDERDDVWDVEVGLPVADHMSDEALDGAYQGELASGIVAYTVHAGACEESRGMQAAYQAVWAWLREHGHETLGGPVEVYLFDNLNTASPADYRTEVAWPIR